MRAGGTDGEQALGKHGAAFKTVADVGREGAQGLPAPVLKQAFALPVNDGEPGYAGLALENGDYVIVAVTGRRAGPAAGSAQARDELRTQLLAIRTEQMLTEQLTALRTRYPVRVVENQP